MHPLIGPRNRFQPAAVASMLSLIVVVTCARHAPAQDDVERRPDGKPRAHVKEWGAPDEVEWTEAELNPDVFRRPRFVSCMARRRLGAANAYHGLTGRGWKLSRLLIPRFELEKLQTGLEMVLSPEFLPRNWDDADVYPFSMDGDGNKLGINDTIHADWSIGDAAVAAYRSLRGTGLCVRIR